jgi:hypothetical protein
LLGSVATVALAGSGVERGEREDDADRLDRRG